MICSNLYKKSFTAGNIFALIFLSLEKLYHKYERAQTISERYFVNLKIDEMVDFFGAMKIKQEKSGLLTMEYFQWYREASDIMRKFEHTAQLKPVETDQIMWSARNFSD